ncbi:putative reverse transcriptase zinc-binding domain-containing protein [Helianthus anomalus]
MEGAALDRLPTKSALIKRNISVGSGLCGFCNDATESVDHLFTACLTVHRVWSRFSAWVNFHPFFAFSFRDILEMHKSLAGNNTQKR